MIDVEALLARKDITFEEAVDYFKERVPVTASQFYKIAEEYRSLAFTVSGYASVQILKRFYEEILAALEEGNTLQEFRANMNDFLETEGYEGITPLQADNIAPTYRRPTMSGTMSRCQIPLSRSSAPTGNTTQYRTRTPGAVISQWMEGYSPLTPLSGTHGSRLTGLDAAAQYAAYRNDKSSSGG